MVFPQRFVAGVEVIAVGAGGEPFLNGAFFDCAIGVEVAVFFRFAAEAFEIFELEVFGFVHFPFLCDFCF